MCKFRSQFWNIKDMDFIHQFKNFLIKMKFYQFDKHATEEKLYSMKKLVNDPKNIRGILMYLIFT